MLVHSVLEKTCRSAHQGETNAPPSTAHVEWEGATAMADMCALHLRMFNRTDDAIADRCIRSLGAMQSGLARFE